MGHSVVARRLTRWPGIAILHVTVRSAAESGRCDGDAAESGFPIIGSPHYRAPGRGAGARRATN